MFIKFVVFLLVATLVQILGQQNAFAWAAGVHMVTGLSALDNISFILPSIASIIGSYPLEYLYGCLAADFFVGKGRGRKGKEPHNWEAGFGLLNNSCDEREAAYAYGFLTHLAADVVAHNLFIPNLISSYPVKKRKGHLYWELKADYSVVPGYLKIAKEVLKADHHECDEMLKNIAGRWKNGFKAKKIIFSQSVRLSDYCYQPYDFIFTKMVVSRQDMREYISIMVDGSRKLVNAFLSDPESSPCLLYDPLGRRKLRLAKQERRRSYPRFDRVRRSVQPLKVLRERLSL